MKNHERKRAKISCVLIFAHEISPDHGNAFLAGNRKPTFRESIFRPGQFVPPSKRYAHVIPPATHETLGRPWPGCAHATAESPWCKTKIDPAVQQLSGSGIGRADE